MADVNTTKIVSLERLGTYDGLIKKYINDADAVINAKSIKTVLLDGDNIKFYKKENATSADTADYTVAISSSDVTALKARVGMDTELNTYQSKTTLTDVVNVLTGTDTTAGSVAKAVKDLADGQVKTNTDAIDAINNETTGILAKAKSASQVFLDAATTPSEGYLKTYVLSQGKTAEGEKIEIGKIDIPKDLVVTAGEVVVIDAEHATTELPVGTYIKLTIANQETPIYINVKDLIDVYTAAKDATQVQLAISDTNEISATIVAGGIGTTELADSAVTTAKITDKNVTKAKLAEDVQTSLGKADSAVQSIATGTTDGTIAVDGTDIAVKGLASAAYVTVDSLNTTAQGYATTAETNAKTYADDLYSIASVDEINKLFDTSE